LIYERGRASYTGGGLLGRHELLFRQTGPVRYLVDKKKLKMLIRRKYWVHRYCNGSGGIDSFVAARELD
jgi:hypothetical protein